jgi:hypothetical protein
MVRAVPIVPIVTPIVILIVAAPTLCRCRRCAVDLRGNGVELNHRGVGVNKHGYHDGGEPGANRDFATAFGGPYYNSYPLQMFDRKLRPMSEVYVGLVCTKREFAEANGYQKYLLDNAANEAEMNKINRATSFYTFHYNYFSSSRVFGYDNTKANPLATSLIAEPATKRARTERDDPYIGMSSKELRGLVGAWRIGKVLDIAATKKDQYYGGPTDTSDRITVNVDVEFKDWRQLRRDLGDLRNLVDSGPKDTPEIGELVPGAPRWLVGADGDEDKGVVLQWPTEYTPSGSDELVISTNRPINPTTKDQHYRSVERSADQPKMPKPKEQYELHTLDQDQKITYKTSVLKSVKAAPLT